MPQPVLHRLLAYTIYHFEVCVRDRAVVGVVGAAGLGRLFVENFPVFQLPVVTILLAVSFTIRIATELLSGQVRRGLND